MVGLHGHLRLPEKNQNEICNVFSLLTVFISEVRPTPLKRFLVVGLLFLYVKTVQRTIMTLIMLAIFSKGTLQS